MTRPSGRSASTSRGTQISRGTCGAKLVPPWNGGRLLGSTPYPPISVESKSSGTTKGCGLDWGSVSPRPMNYALSAIKLGPLHPVGRRNRLRPPGGEVGTVCAAGHTADPPIHSRSRRGAELYWGGTIRRRDDTIEWIRGGGAALDRRGNSTWRPSPLTTESAGEGERTMNNRDRPDTGTCRCSRCYDGVGRTPLPCCRRGAGGRGGAWKRRGRLREATRVKQRLGVVDVPLPMTRGGGVPPPSVIAPNGGVRCPGSRSGR